MVDLEEKIISEESSPSDKSNAGVSFHPGFGCAIGGLAILMACAFVMFCRYAGREQDKALAEICVDELVPTQMLEVSPERKEEVVARLKEYGDLILSGEKTSLELTVDDLNGLISSVPDLKDYRGMVYFKKIEKNGSIFADIAFPIRKLNGGERYFLGEAEFLLKREDNNIHLNIENLYATNKQIPDGFKNNLSRYLWLLPFQNIEELNPVFEGTDNIKFFFGKIVIGNK